MRKLDFFPARRRRSRFPLSPPSPMPTIRWSAARRCMPTRTSSRTPSTRRITPRWSPPSRPPAWSRRCRAPARSPSSLRSTRPSTRCRPAPSKRCSSPRTRTSSTKILTCHVVAAKAMSADVTKMVKDDGGAHKVKTVGGCELTLKADGRQGHRHRRERQRRQCDDRRRRAVERRHPRHRQGPAAEDVSSRGPHRPAEARQRTRALGRPRVRKQDSCAVGSRLLIPRNPSRSSRRRESFPRAAACVSSRPSIGCDFSRRWRTSLACDREE